MTAATADKHPAARSKTTNQPHALPGIDGRSRWARRRSDLMRALCAEIARPLSALEQLAVSNIAGLQCRIEQLQIEMCRGQAIDDEAIVRFSNAIARQAAAIGIETSDGPSLSLADYLKRKQATP